MGKVKRKSKKIHEKPKSSGGRIKANYRRGSKINRAKLHTIGMKGGAGGQRAKRKGRLPSKVIFDKNGNPKTVYYDPSKGAKGGSRSRSKYIDTQSISQREMRSHFDESFKRMLHFDHSGNRSRIRDYKNDTRHTWGDEARTNINAMIDKNGLQIQDWGNNLKKYKEKNKGGGGRDMGTGTSGLINVDGKSIHKTMYQYRGEAKGSSAKAELNDYMNELFARSGSVMTNKRIWN